MDLSSYKSRELVEIVCNHCSVSFQRTKKDIQRNIRLKRNQFCSKKCSDSSKSKQVSCKCLQCGNKFLGFEDRKFCGQGCTARFNNSLREAKPPVLCKNCGKECSYRKNIYCSGSCQMNLQYTEFIKRWKDGQETGVGSGTSTSDHIKKYLRIKYNDQCVKCGWNEVHPITRKVPVQLDHIDGNAENNKEENLRLLCPNCHSLTETFGNLNRGKGRKNRYKKADVV